MWTTEDWYQEGRSYVAARREWAHNYAWRGLMLMRENMPGVPDEEIIRRLNAFNRQRIDAVPDLRAYPELRGMRELILAEWRGVQEGAGFSDAELACYTAAFPYYFRYLITGHPPVGCSYIFFPTSDVGPILANNLDTNPTEKFPPPHWPAINEHLIIGSVSSGVLLDEESPEIFPVSVTRLIARYCRTTEEAVEMFTRYNYFWGPANRIVIDRNKRVAMIEKSACRIGVRYSEDGFGFIKGMTAEEPGMHDYLADRRAASLQQRGLTEDSIDMRYWRASEKRRVLMNELLDEARKNPTRETMRRMIQFRDAERGNVCVNGEIPHPGDPPVEHTIRTIIWQLRDRRALWWARESEKPSFENRKPDVQFPDVLRWE